MGFFTSEKTGVFHCGMAPEWKNPKKNPNFEKKKKKKFNFSRFFSLNPLVVQKPGFLLQNNLK